MMMATERGRKDVGSALQSVCKYMLECQPGYWLTRWRGMSIDELIHWDRAGLSSRMPTCDGGRLGVSLTVNARQCFFVLRADFLPNSSSILCMKASRALVCQIASARVN